MTKKQIHVYIPLGPLKEPDVKDTIYLSTGITIKSQL